ncbi:hypothetical protein [Aquimarina sp. 2201CG5-10]|uniref:hypothetical protein n=1 Tax=Aquimarina callyspongiae TaxID=3098150 RepID=UPI002AB4214B|nr:hypothetical protein [Aquimarina sp. 2201CG5-10]MDY8138418.1 hypothetical protein [Aquimarina sp. 2201CG5-10]
MKTTQIFLLLTTKTSFEKQLFLSLEEISNLLSQRIIAIRRNTIHYDHFDLYLKLP